MREFIKEIMACPECLSELNYSENLSHCKGCSAEWTIRNNTVYFTEIKGNITPDGIGYAKDKAAWSAFKKRNFSFIRSETEDLEKESIILDIGAGPGFFDEIFYKFDKYLSIDFYHYPNVDIVSNIIEKRIPIRPSSIHCIILSNVLEHLSRPEKLLLECSRILKGKGKLIVIVPFMFKLHQEPYDYYRYTHYKLREMFEENGFGDIVIKKMGTIVEVLKGIRYEFNKLLKENSKYPFLLNQFLRIQYHFDNLINKLFLRMDEEYLTNQPIFPGYSCTARKKS